MAESRVKKSLLNARVNLIFYFLALVLAFFSRKIFLNTLGVDFIGLTGTLYNLLGFLNLAELGIGSAIGYVLYKPLFDQDETKINEIISVFGYLYRWIGLIILGAGCLLACFLPLIFPATGFQFGIIYFAYFSFLASSLIGYFANYKQTLLGADQKNYVVTAYFQSATIVKTLIQMVIAYYTGNYYLWVAIELLFGIIYSFILNWKVNQVYPWLKSEVRRGKELFKKYPEVMKYTKQLFVHQIGAFVQFQTVPLLIYAFVSLQTVAFYGNYTMITDKLSQFINNLLGSTGAGVGNLIAEGNREKIKSVFWELFGIRMLVGGIFCVALFFLLEPFIILWIGEKYLLDDLILILILFTVFINFTRGSTDQFLYGYGLFWDIWAPVVEAGINIGVAVIGGFLWGLPGLLLGGIISLLIIVGVWKPYFLYHWGFKESVIYYWLGYFKHVFLILLPAVGCYFVLPFITTANPAEFYVNWILYALLLISIYTISAYLLLYVFTQGIRAFTNRVVSKYLRQ
jgi:O-antigen/teichoic acid export membrane protein